MTVSVYNLRLERIGVIETWVSLVWQECYNTEGSFQLEVRQRSDLLPLLKPEYYCGLTGHDTLMVLKSVQIKDGAIVVNGFPATHILDDRVSTDVVSNENAEAAMRRLFAAMAPYPCLELGEVAGLTAKYTPQISDRSLQAYFENIAQECGLGFRFRHDKKARKLLFEVYRRGENPNAKYSTAYGNMGDIAHSVTTNGYKNVAVVAGAGEGDARITVLAGNASATGADRREMYVDARQEQPKDGESDAAYKARLVALGEQKLVEQIRVENITFTLDDDRARLGDIVFCYIPEIGVNVKARIIGMTETSQDNVTTREAAIGTPVVVRRY